MVFLKLSLKYLIGQLKHKGTDADAPLLTSWKEIHDGTLLIEDTVVNNGMDVWVLGENTVDCSFSVSYLLPVFSFFFDCFTFLAFSIWGSFLWLTSMYLGVLTVLVDFTTCSKTSNECYAIVRDEDYHSLYRFPRSNVEWLAEHFLEDTAETRGGALNSREKTQIFFRLLSDPGFQIGVGKGEDIHRTTVSKTAKFVLMKIIQKSHIWLRFLINNIAEAQQE
nr:unnamed protein product [Callosobruchus analis]